MTELLNPIAELDQPDSGKIVKPLEAYSLKSNHKFYCPDHDCKDPERILIPARSKLDKYFFKHKPDFAHDIHPQTLLHKLAVKWFEELETYQIPKASEIFEQTLKLDKNKTELEFRKLEKLIPDVKLTAMNDFTFAVEIVVTSDIKPEKAKLIEKFNLPTLRVDLSQFYNDNKDLCRTNYDFVQKNLEKLLTSMELKRWVITPKSDISNKLDLKAVPSESTDNTGCLVVLITFGAILLIQKLFK